MGLLSIEDVQEGMVLEEDLELDGQVLIKAGVVLAERHLRLCRSWGVDFLSIEGVDASQVEGDFLASIPPEIMEKAEELARWNCHHLTLKDPLHQALYQIHLRRLLQGGSS